MHVLEMIEPRKQMLQKEVISIKQPSQHMMMILSVNSCLKFQLVIHMWVLIHPVMNFTILTQTNLAHLSLPDINFNPDYSDQIQTQNQIHFQRKPARHKWTGPIYLPGHIYKLLSQEARDALQKYSVEAIQKLKTSRNLNETDLIHDVYEHAQEKLPPSIDEEEFQECQEFNTD